MRKSKSLSLMPFARRMSLPAKRFSEHFASAVSSPFQTPCPSPFSSPFNSPLSSPVQTPAAQLDSTFYFSPLGHHAEHVTFEEHVTLEDQEVEVEEMQTVVERVETEAGSEPRVVRHVAGVAKMKRVARKAKSILCLRRQS
jgi:hypothetical protein